MKTIQLSAWELMVTVTALVLALVDVLANRGFIDSPVYILLLIALAPFALHRLQSLTWRPGEIDITLQSDDVEKLDAKALANEMKKPVAVAVSSRVGAKRASAEKAQEDRPQLQLAELRHALENRLRQMASVKGIAHEYLTFSEVVAALADCDVLKQPEADTLLDAANLLYKKAHQAVVTPDLLKLAHDVGPGILAEMEERLAMMQREMAC